MGRSKRSRVYHLYIAYMRAACVCVQVETQEVSVHLPKNLSKGATPLDTIHQVPLTFLPSSFRSPPVGPQV